MGIAADISLLEQSALIELFVLDATELGLATIYRFHAGTNRLTQNVVWQGQTYQPLPIKAEGFDQSVDGPLPRPMLRVADVFGLVTALTDQYRDLVGAAVIRKRTHAKYLDAVNFPGGNPSADPTQQYMDERWEVEAKKRHIPGRLIEFELASPMDLQGRMLGRVMVDVCAWQYRGMGCGYAGGPVAQLDDTPTSNPALDRCGKRVASCKLRFGANAELPYGGWEIQGRSRVS
jgi:lambda family phage minor tail protein L